MSRAPMPDAGFVCVNCQRKVPRVVLRDATPITEDEPRTCAVCHLRLNRGVLVPIWSLPHFARKPRRAA